MNKAFFTIIFSLFFLQLFAQKQYLIMVSLDGFRWDYCSKTETPVFDSITKNGVKAESLEASFPTKTFPNHYTLVTGLYPDHHGIVNNSFYSPSHRAVYSIGDRKKVEDGTYYSGQPIWNIAENQGVKTASYFWVGSEADINMQQPTYWKTYEHHFPFEQRIDTVISWLQLPEKERPHLILLYFNEPDSRGHMSGPDSKEIEQLIAELDQLIGKLFRKISKLDIRNKVNVIITSDHGMAQVSKERTVLLQNHLKESWVERIVGSNPVFNIWSKEAYNDSIIHALSKVKHIKCWKNNEIPERFNYGSNPRTGTFTILADSSWSVQYKSDHLSNSKGAHGYDNQNKDMHGIFYAIGPAFKTNYKAGTIKNVDIYPLIAHILGLEIPKIDGKLERISYIVHENP